MIYLDNSATTKPCKEAIAAVAENMEQNFGNASSLHKMGINAEIVLKNVKKTILDKLSLEGEIYFTSGATESNNTVLFGVPKAYKHNGKKIVSTSFEHPSVDVPLNELSSMGYEVIKLDPLGEKPFEERIIDEVDDNTLMVSVMWVNNETGYITDTAKI